MQLRGRRWTVDAPPLDCGGGHVVMDYEDFFVDAAPAGEAVMDAMRGAVASSGVREVHHKLVVLGERGESPPGFTSAVLIDESHVTAHCYSTRGWLAVDVFTCGGHDPCALADDLHQRICAYAPGARCVQRRFVPRFLHEAAPAASSRRAPVGVLTMGAPDGDGGESEAAAEAEEELDVMEAYRRRMDAEGGEAAFRLKGDLQQAKEDLEKTGKDVRYALDLDGAKAKRGPNNSLDLLQWRSTVGFFGAVVLLSAFAFLTTDFGPGDELADAAWLEGFREAAGDAAEPDVWEALKK